MTPSKASVSRPYALPSRYGLRRAWDTSVLADGLTPERLAAILRAADQGDGHAYLSLAMEMERRDAHYRSVLGTRKRAITRLPVTVVAASEDQADERLADEIRAVVAAPGFRGMKAHALDALGKGYSVIEMRWDTARTPWVPRDRTDPKTGERVRGYQWIDQRWFAYDMLTGRELRLRDESDYINGIPLPPYRYIVHEPELMSGLPLSAGLARVAAVAYIAKSYTLKDWLSFAEVYGMPLRLGRYESTASEDDISTLTAAVVGLGTDAAAVMPESMRIEFVEAAKSSSSDVFSALAKWADDQVSKLVLGQTASAEGGAPGMGGQEAQAEVRADIRDSDADELADTLNRDLVGAYLDINYGPIDQESAPRIVIAEPDEDDIPMLTDALARLVPLGLRVGAQVVRTKLGLPDPNDADDLLGAQPAPHPGESLEAHRALAPRPSIPREDYADEQTPRLDAAADRVVGGWLERIRADLDDAIAAGEDTTRFAARLLTLYPDLPDSALVDILSEALTAAGLAGRADAAA